MGIYIVYFHFYPSTSLQCVQFMIEFLEERLPAVPEDTIHRVSVSTKCQKYVRSTPIGFQCFAMQAISNSQSRKGIGIGFGPYRLCKVLTNSEIRRPAGVFCGLFWLVLLVLVSIYGLSLRADFSTA